MIEIEFSVMENNAGDAEQMRPLVETFEQQYHIHVNLTGITWDKGWTDIVNFGIYGHGPDVSSIGTTWIGSLASMRTLRPIPRQGNACPGRSTGILRVGLALRIFNQ